MVKIDVFSLDNPPIVQTSEQAVPIPKILGRMRIAGQVIWADEFKIVQPTKKDDQIGAGFSLSFAIALCEGEIDHISKMWVNDSLQDMTDINWRYYKGSADQIADPLLENIFGVGKAPAFRDVAYVIFEDLHLEPFGNMVPKFSFEVINATGELEKQVQAVAVIPGATEFGYHTVSIVRESNYEFFPENQHGFTGETDFVASIDELCNICPNLQKISLIVPWFGDDLRASHIKIAPRVDNAQKNTSPEQWMVNGVIRSTAALVSQIDGHAAFGGTPSDDSVLAAIAEFKRRGIEVVFYPFILMDVPAANNLPNPQGGTDQPIYPWRGRITCHPAIGQASSPDKTAAATSQIANFFGDCPTTDIRIYQNLVLYYGSGDWGYRRMILHYAKLCKLAGGVNGFLLGSELIGITTVRDSRTHFPAIDQLINLADEVAQALPLAKISYGADWSEYFGHHPQDGTGDIFFHLDDLWGHNNIDFVGIDAYWPLSDWRDEPEHLDQVNGASHIYQRDYLRGNIGAGEGYDYYYASQNARDAQIRTPIDDTAYGKHWVFRTKDIKQWWGNPHYNRIDGVEVATSTSWVAESKPIWLTEIGCPAIDKGSNQPNVFYDPASSEGKIPYHSNDNRDDVIQRRYLEVLLEYYQNDGVNNPISSVYGGRMLDTKNAYIWAYDARPYPAFPLLKDVWADGDNWNYGHWLNGRLGMVPLDKLIVEFTSGMQVDVTEIVGQVEGYLIDKLQSPIEILQNILQNFGLLAFIRDDILIFKHQDSDAVVSILDEHLADTKLPDLYRADDLGVVSDAHLKYISDDGSYSSRVTSELSDDGVSEYRFDEFYQLPAVLSQSYAAKLVSDRLKASRGQNKILSVTVGAEFGFLESGDVFSLNMANKASDLNGNWRVKTVETGLKQKIEAVSADFAIGMNRLIERDLKTGLFETKPPHGQALFEPLNLPILATDTNVVSAEKRVLFAAFVKPWGGEMSLFQDVGGSYIKRAVVKQRAVIGHIETVFNAGVIDRIDHANKIVVRLYAGEISSISEAELMAGKNLAVIGNDGGEWEIIQFKNAEMVSENLFEISYLVRGKYGSASAMKTQTSALSRFVILNEAVQSFDLNAEEMFALIDVKYGLSSKNLEHESYQTAQWQHDPVALKPFAPVHVKALKNANTLEVSWIRQTRHGGENWAIAQVQLNEQIEAYEVEIWPLNGGVALRQFDCNNPEFIYSEADQIADFGGLAQDFKLKIYQMSALVGRGTEKEVEIHV